MDTLPAVCEERHKAMIAQSCECDAVGGKNYSACCASHHDYSFTATITPADLSNVY